MKGHLRFVACAAFVLGVATSARADAAPESEPAEPESAYDGPIDEIEEPEAAPPLDRCLVETHHRIDVIQLALDHAAAPARTWRDVWLVALSGLLIGNAALASAMYDNDAWVDYAVGAVSSTLALGTLLIFGPKAPAAADELRETGEGDLAALLAKLDRAEELLERAARGERFGRSFVAHAASSAVAIGGGLYLWLDRDRLGGGLRYTLGALAIGQTRIWTQPTEAAEAWDGYVERFAASRCAVVRGAVRPAPGVSAMVHPMGLGLGLTVTF